MFDFSFRLRSHRQAIFVPKSVTAESAEIYALVSSVVDWLNLARNQGCYIADEIAKEALQTYNADYYYAQVCNGGHSQFRHNSRMDPTTLVHALAGLKAAQLTELAACLGSIRDEPQMNEAALSKLDDRFFAAYGDYHSRMNSWLLPRVRVMPDAKYQTHLKKFLTHNRVRDQRFRDRKIFRLQGMIENDQLAGYARMACDLGFQFVGIRPGRFATIAGVQTLIWGIAVRDEAGDKLLHGMELEGHYLLISQMPDAPVDTGEKLLALFQSGHHLKTQSVTEQCAYARKARLGSIAAILLEHASGVSAEDVSAIHLIRFDERPEQGDVVLIHRLNKPAPFSMLVAEHKVLLIDIGEDVAVAQMSARDVARALGKFDSRHRVH